MEKGPSLEETPVFKDTPCLEAPLFEKYHITSIMFHNKGDKQTPTHFFI